VLFDNIVRQWIDNGLIGLQGFDDLQTVNEFRYIRCFLGLFDRLFFPHIKVSGVFQYADKDVCSVLVEMFQEVAVLFPNE